MLHVNNKMYVLHYIIFIFPATFMIVESIPIASDKIKNILLI